MMAKCISASLSIIGVNAENKYACCVNVEKFDELEVGEKYRVFAIEGRLGDQRWIYIDAVGHGQFPSPYPLELFSTDSGEIPNHWRISLPNPSEGEGLFLISFPEWVENPNFFENLVDGVPYAAEAYRREILRDES